MYDSSFFLDNKLFRPSERKVRDKLVAVKEDRNLGPTKI